MKILCTTSRMPFAVDEIRKLGEVTRGPGLSIALDGQNYTWPLAELQAAWGETIEKLMSGEAAEPR